MINTTGFNQRFTFPNFLDELQRKRLLRKLDSLRLSFLFPTKSPPRGGGGTPLYKSYRYVPPQRVWFLCHFDLTTGINFAHFGLESGIVFQ